MLSELDHHLDNMAVAVTNKKAVLDALLTTNIKLTKLTSEKLSKIEKLLLNPKFIIPLPDAGATTPTSTSNECTIVQLQAAIKHKWVPGAFSSTHGWGVGPNHTSAICKGGDPAI